MFTFPPLLSDRRHLYLSIKKPDHAQDTPDMNFFLFLSRELNSLHINGKQLQLGDCQQRRPFSGLAHEKKKLPHLFFLLQINCHALHLKLASSFPPNLAFAANAPYY